MTPTETAAILRQYNQWRRGNLEGMPQPDPREIGEAIDAAIEMIERMEKQEPVCWTTNPPSGHYSRFRPEVDRWIENGWNVVPLYALPGVKGE